MTGECTCILCIQNLRPLGMGMLRVVWAPSYLLEVQQAITCCYSRGLQQDSVQLMTAPHVNSSAYLVYAGVLTVGLVPEGKICKLKQTLPSSASHAMKEVCQQEHQ